MLRLREKFDKEMEFQLKEMQLELEAETRQLDGSGDHVPNIKAMKLPLFHEEKDDFDAYLNTGLPLGLVFLKILKTLNVLKSMMMVPIYGSSMACNLWV